MNDRIKRREIALQDPDRKSLDAAINVLSGKEGVLEVEPVKRGIRVSYRLQQTGFADLLTELHSNEVNKSQGTLDRFRFDLVNFLEQHERDNLLSCEGWWQRMQAIYIACQTRPSGARVTTGDHRHWQHYTNK